MATNCEQKLDSISSSLINPVNGQGLAETYGWFCDNIYAPQKYAIDNLLIEQKKTNKILNHLSLKLTGTEVS